MFNNLNLPIRCRVVHKTRLTHQDLLTIEVKLESSNSLIFLVNVFLPQPKRLAASLLRPAVCFRAISIRVRSKSGVASSKMLEFDQSLKEFLKYNMYFNKDVLKKTNKGKKIISKLFFLIKKNPYKFFKEKVISKKNKERSICDFIAGMTDRYAINLERKL